jgi:hypothetical protein
MELALIIAVILLLDVFALFWGYDSRDSFRFNADNDR